MLNNEIKEKAKLLRKNGKTYKEIKEIIGYNMPKSTLSYWLKTVELPPFYKEKIRINNKINLEKARKLAKKVKLLKIEEKLKYIYNQNKYLSKIFINRNVGKIVLSMIYFAEGGSGNRSSLMFGNSKQIMVEIFLHLLRNCYNIDENKFRCTLQCRADQDINKLEQFWSKITKIPLKLFYKARVDPRSVGKVTKNKDYLGVCRIDYYDVKILHELQQIVIILYQAIKKDG